MILCAEMKHRTALALDADPHRQSLRDKADPHFLPLEARGTGVGLLTHKRQLRLLPVQELYCQEWMQKW